MGFIPARIGDSAAQEAGAVAPALRSIDSGAYTEPSTGDRAKFAVSNSVDLPDLAINAEFKVGTRSGEMQFKGPTNSEFEAKIMRFDNAISDENFEKSARSLDMLIRAMESGHDLKVGPDGKPFLNKDSSLSPERRWQFHEAVLGDLELMYEQMNSRFDFGQHLLKSGRIQEFTNMQLSGLNKAVRLTTPIKMSNGLDYSPLELMKREANLLAADQGKFSQPERAKALQDAKNILDHPRHGNIKLIEEMSNLKKK